MRQPDTTGIATTLSAPTGGLSADTELLGSDGIHSIVDVRPGDEVYAMSPQNRAVKLKPVLAIDEVRPADAVVIDSRRVDLCVSPSQYIPYGTQAIDRIRLQRANRLGERWRYECITDWSPLGGERKETIDVTSLLDSFEAVIEYDDGHGHTFRALLPDGCDPSHYRGTGRYSFDGGTFRSHQERLEAVSSSVRIRHGTGHWRQPYRFCADYFLQFIAWFVAEGCVYDKPDRNSAEVKIAQEIPRYRSTIRRLLERLDITFHEDDRSFNFGSKMYGDLLKSLCGTGSRSKRLPEFVWDCSTGQKQLVVEMLLAGDGNANRTYYTVSDTLAGQVLRLCVESGITPRYHRRRDWRIYCRHVAHGFNSTTHTRTVAATQPHYRLTVEDYSLILAGRNGTFQWVAAGAIA